MAANWFDGWDIDENGDRIRFNPRTNEMPGYIPISATPDEYKAIPAYSQILKDPTAFKQGPDGQWYMSTDAQGKTSSVMERTGGLGKMLNNGAGFWALAGSMLGGALGGAFPGYDPVTGASIAKGSTGILSQLGIQNPFSSVTNPTGQVPPGSETWGVNPRDAASWGDFIKDLPNPLESVDALKGMVDSYPFPGGEFGNVWETYLNNVLPQTPFASNPYGASLFGTAQGISSGILPSLTGSIGSTAAKSLIGKLLSGEAGIDDYAKIAGALGSSALGFLGAEKNADALSGVSDKYLALGAPYRGKLASTFDPSFDLMNEPGFKNAMDVSTKGVLANLSAKVGNPYDQPAAVAEAQKYIMGNVALPQLNTLRSQLGTFGQLGTNIAGTADMANAGNAGQGYDALGYGLGQLTGNNNSLEDLLKKYGGLLGNTRLTSGSSI